MHLVLLSPPPVSRGELTPVLCPPSPGAFEHYPNLKWQDNDFVRVNAMHDWIHFYDVFDRQISANQTYELMGYLPYAFAPWFVHFANHSNATRPTEFPKQDYEVRARARRGSLAFSPGFD